MALTKAQLVTRVQTLTARTDLDTQILQFLNDALKRAARFHTWRDLMTEKTATLTTGTYRYSFPSDLKDCLGIRLIDAASSVYLIEISQVRLDAFEPYPPSRGNARPQYYGVDGNYLEIFPPPDNTYEIRIRYNRWPVDLVNSSDTPEIDSIDDVLSALAAADTFALTGDFDSAAYWEARGLARLREARTQDMRRPVWAPWMGSMPSGGRVLPGEYWNRPDIERA